MAFLLIIFTCVVSVWAEDETEKHWDSSCRMELYGHYFAKECVPMGKGPCPESFSCPTFERDSSKCYYKGQAYNSSEVVPVEDPCSRDCFCRRGYYLGDMSRITCANVECPYLFQRPDPNCRRLYRPGECCPYDEICARDGVTTTPNPIICHANNKTYLEGSRIYFIDYPCQTCVCGAGFDGPFGPGCRTFTCGFDFRYVRELSLGCIPIYFNGRCCPFEWICPDDSKLPPVPSPPPVHKEDGLCYLGGHQIELGETLDVSRCNIVCGCLTPPDITCVQYPSCREASSSSLFPGRTPEESTEGV